MSKKDIFIIGFFLGVLLCLLFFNNLNAQEHVVVLHPVDSDFVAMNNEGKNLLTLTEGNTTNLLYLFPGYKDNRIKYSGNVEFWMDADSSAVGDSDNLTITIQPQYYDAKNDTMLSSTTAALGAENASTDQAQLATIANGVKAIVTALDFAPNTNFVITRQSDLGLCWGALVKVTLDATAGSITYTPKLLVLSNR